MCVCVLAVYYKAQAQIISNSEFKLWTFLQGTESRVATFLAETCVMSHQSPVSAVRYVCILYTYMEKMHTFRAALTMESKFRLSLVSASVFGRLHDLYFLKSKLDIMITVSSYNK